MSNDQNDSLGYDANELVEVFDQISMFFSRIHTVAEAAVQLGDQESTAYCLTHEIVEMSEHFRSIVDSHNSRALKFRMIGNEKEKRSEV